ncbi:MAG TPA: HEAT repeat domain-containing protein [Pyrinomonadaceae bacterium]|jgi:HEAT repeat protein|nr:HEAT repeat domain-containing protein [Pyrinomonadaceae bacterium]
MRKEPTAQARNVRVRRVNSLKSARRRGSLLLFTLCCLFVLNAAAPTHARTQSDLTPLQREVRVQTARLSSADVEERRDAVTRLGAMGRPEGSRAAAAALADPSAVVRATAARAVLSLGAAEAATLILPLLRDRDEFVRREAAYALGLTRSRAAVGALAAAVETDKRPAVRGAAAVALGQIGDASAAPALAGALARRLPASGFFGRLLRKKVEEDEFVRRAAAVSLGQIASRESVPALVEALSDERAPSDIRRECARALGIIGDVRAVPALRSALAAQDPYLSRVAFEALKKLDPQSATRPVG